LRYLLDTNVVSELRKVAKGKTDPIFSNWASGLTNIDLYTSAIVIYELELGIQLLANRDLAAAKILRIWLEESVIPVFGDRILPVDSKIAKAAADLSIPNTAPFRDSLIGATAIVHGLKIATRNTKDFSKYNGLEIINPWSVQGTH